MKTLNFLLLLIILHLYACSNKTDNSKKQIAIKDTSFNDLNGLYIGLEKMDYNVNPRDSKSKWYHLTHLKIKGDSSFLDQNPISIYKNDTSFSASDGAFYYYSGKVTKLNTTVKINLKELYCDYCGEQVKEDSNGTWVRVYRTKEYLAKLADSGLIINGFLFRKTKQLESLISENPLPERVNAPAPKKFTPPK